MKQFCNRNINRNNLKKNLFSLLVTKLLKYVKSMFQNEVHKIFFLRPFLAGTLTSTGAEEMTLCLPDLPQSEQDTNSS